MKRREIEVEFCPAGEEISPLALARFVDEYVKLALELDQQRPEPAAPTTAPLRIA